MTDYLKPIHSIFCRRVWCVGCTGWSRVSKPFLGQIGSYQSGSLPFFLSKWKL